MRNRPSRFEPRLLLIDDDALTREYLADLLSERFPQIAVAATGAEGVELYTQIQPHIVITDIVMPGLSGLDVARQIRKLNPASRIIFMTAYADTEHSDMDVMADCVSKPIDLDRLFEAIDKSAVS